MPTTTPESDLYYDPFDVEIDKDPHPVWKRMRDEAPLYYNERLGFYALSRFEDVERALVDWDTYRSGRGSVLEFMLAGMAIEPGMFLMEDPPEHDVHRALMGRVFTPSRMKKLEHRAREFCAQSLDPFVGANGFDFIVNLGAQMPMQMIGMLLGIPEQDQEVLRDLIDAAIRIEDDGATPAPGETRFAEGLRFISDYIDWRREHPSDDLMTDMLNAEFEDEHGVRRGLTRRELITYTTLIAGAGNETTTRLVGWTATLLAQHPDQRREIVEDRSLVPQAIEEVLRYEPPSPVVSRYAARDVEHYGQTVPQDGIVVLLPGAANRDERQFENGDRFDIHRKMSHHLAFGYGLHFCLGAALARLEGRVALDEVLERFPEWEIDWDNAKQAHTPTVRGWQELPVVTP